MAIEVKTADPTVARTWTVVDGHYPCFRELRGASFKVSVVMSATDISFDQALQREADLALMAAAPDLLKLLEYAVKEFTRGNQLTNSWLVEAEEALEKARG